MTIDSRFVRRGAFTPERPLDALRIDHRLLRQLFEHYFQAGDETEKRDIGMHLLLMLEMHAALEEGVFYPRVQETDPTLVAHCEHEHEQAHRIIEMLKPMDEGDPQAEQLFYRLADTVFLHMDNEEEQLFPRIEQAGFDLSAIGHEMMALELRMVAVHAQRPIASGLRQ